MLYRNFYDVWNVFKSVWAVRCFRRPGSGRLQHALDGPGRTRNAWRCWRSRLSSSVYGKHTPQDCLAFITFSSVLCFSAIVCTWFACCGLRIDCLRILPVHVRHEPLRLDCSLAAHECTSQVGRGRYKHLYGRNGIFSHGTASQYPPQDSYVHPGHDYGRASRPSRGGHALASHRGAPRYVLLDHGHMQGGYPGQQKGGYGGATRGMSKFRTKVRCPLSDLIMMG